MGQRIYGTVDENSVLDVAVLVNNFNRFELSNMKFITNVDRFLAKTDSWNVADSAGSANKIIATYRNSNIECRLWRNWSVDLLKSYFMTEILKYLFDNQPECKFCIVMFLQILNN